MDVICISHGSLGFTDSISGISPQTGAMDITHGWDLLFRWHSVELEMMTDDTGIGAPRMSSSTSAVVGRPKRDDLHDAIRTHGLERCTVTYTKNLR